MAREVCFECDVEIDMLEPTVEEPGRRFGCPKCGDIYVGVEFAAEEELSLN
jgi:predicted RNA-binding Zn-ribbon protein involved in translation (DUF1610 family)